MRIGVPTEVLNNESRVAVTPAGVSELTTAGHEVLVQSGAGIHAGHTDENYTDVGATIVDGATPAWDAELILKVKEPHASEYDLLRKDQILFTYLHLAASRACTDALLEAGTTAIAYETVTQGRTLPLLSPMSEVAGRLSAQIGATLLQQPAGGSGILMGGVPGTRPAKVVVIGAGNAGEQAARTAQGMGADVTIVDISASRLHEIDNLARGHIKTMASSKLAIAELVKDADLVIGSVLIPGAAAPKLVTLDMVATMRPGSVLVDIAIDQGGCFEGSKPTTHDNPTYRVHDALYYCVTNMPGAVPQTSTAALTNATLPYVMKLANNGWREALATDEGFASGLNTHDGKVTNRGVAEAHGMDFVAPADVLAS